jgi:hypothetical protein
LPSALPPSATLIFAISPLRSSSKRSASGAEKVTPSDKPAG